jgi:hypothetical protein
VGVEHYDRFSEWESDIMSPYCDPFRAAFGVVKRKITVVCPAHFCVSKPLLCFRDVFHVS